jgi:ankyrin repeat protein
MTAWRLAHTTCAVGAGRLAAITAREDEEMHFAAGPTLEGGKTTLHHMVLTGTLQDVERVVLAQANLIDVVDELHRSPLLLATERGVSEIALLLLDHDADPNVASYSGLTPLHIAAYTGDHTLAKALLRHGARAQCANESGMTPLHNAVIGGHWPVIRLLIAHGAEVNASDREGRTALHCAVERRKGALVRYLLSQGTDPVLRDTRGWTPRQLALHMGHTALEKLLRLYEQAR